MRERETENKKGDIARESELERERERARER